MLEVRNIVLVNPEIKVRVSTVTCNKRYRRKKRQQYAKPFLTTVITMEEQLITNNGKN